jgi:hypothetical protein
VERFGRKRGIIRELVNSHHIDHGHGLTGVSQVDHVEVSGMVMLDVADEEVVDGVLLRRSRTL